MGSSRHENKTATKSFKLHIQFPVGYPASSSFYSLTSVTYALRAVSGPLGRWRGGGNPHVREGDARWEFRIRGNQSGRSLPADVLWGSFVTHSFLPWGRNECVTNEPQRTSAGRLIWAWLRFYLTSKKSFGDQTSTQYDGFCFCLFISR